MAKKGIITLYILLSVISGFSLESFARNHKVDSLVNAGDSLRMRYQFEKSLAAYTKALEELTDSSGVVTDSIKALRISDNLLLSENGRNMASFAGKPNVIARHTFSIKDFFLYYPLADKSWRLTPNQLDSSSAHPYSKALYAPDNSDVLYYSAEDGDGIRNIYRTELRDSVWTFPSLINEQITSASDEIYPVLSPDGRSLYFASAGLYGVGGYDLYVSEWDDEASDWSAPLNLGFPYSSPSDDFLLVNTEDGEYTLFASNRDCSKDSVCVYVLEYDSMPVRKAVDDPDELLELSRLEPSGEAVSEGRDVNADIPESVDTKRYMDKMEEVRALRDTLSACETVLEDNRNRFILSSDEDERIALTNKILEIESSMPAIQDSLTRATEVLRKIEMEFLFSGVVIDPDKLMAAADREVVGEATSYTFMKMNPGDKIALKILPPPVQFDYTFKILDQAQMAADNTLPSGLVYQIQLFSVSSKASLKSLKGLSPVFEVQTPNGRFVYRVGLFNTYKDVLAKLNTVKRLGFRNAFIVAFNDGEDMTVSKARSLEAKLAANPIFYEVLLTPDEGDLDEASVSGISQQAQGKDIARIDAENGEIAYVIRPFSDRNAADNLATFIKAMGLGTVEIRKIQ